jgi:hypothetical protein
MRAGSACTSIPAWRCRRWALIGGVTAPVRDRCAACRYERCPDRHAAPLAAAAIEIGVQAGAATLPAIRVRKARVVGGKAIPARFEPIKLVAGGENIVSEDGDVAQRPGEQRGDNHFREARRAVLPDMPVARNAGGRLSGPGLECKASASEVVTIVIEIGDHFEEVADDDGSSGRIVAEMTA